MSFLPLIPLLKPLDSVLGTGFYIWFLKNKAAKFPILNSLEEGAKPPAKEKEKALSAGDKGNSLGQEGAKPPAKEEIITFLPSPWTNEAQLVYERLIGAMRDDKSPDIPEKLLPYIVQLGLIYNRLGAKDKALEYLREATAIDGLGRHRFFLAQLLFEMGDSGKSLAHLEELYKREIKDSKELKDSKKTKEIKDPKDDKADKICYQVERDGEFYRLYALVLHSVARFQQACTALEEMSKNFEMVPELLILWGECLLLQGDYEGAALKCKEALDKEVQDPRGHFWYACTLIQKGDFHQAIHHFNQAISLDANHIDSIFELAKLYYFIKQDGEYARELLNKIIDLVPDHSDSRLFLSDLEAEKGRYKQALAHLDALPNQDRDPQIAVKRVDILMGQRLFEKALPLLDKLYSSIPAQVLNRKAQAFEKMGDFESAISVLEKLVDLDENGEKKAKELNSHLNKRRMAFLWGANGGTHLILLRGQVADRFFAPYTGDEILQNHPYLKYFGLFSNFPLEGAFDLANLAEIFDYLGPVAPNAQGLFDFFQKVQERIKAEPMLLAILARQGIIDYKFARLINNSWPERDSYKARLSGLFAVYLKNKGEEDPFEPTEGPKGDAKLLSCLHKSFLKDENALVQGAFELEKIVDFSIDWANSMKEKVILISQDNVSEQRKKGFWHFVGDKGIPCLKKLIDSENCGLDTAKFLIAVARGDYERARALKNSVAKVLNAGDCQGKSCGWYHSCFRAQEENAREKAPVLGIELADYSPDIFVPRTKFRQIFHLFDIGPLPEKIKGASSICCICPSLYFVNDIYKNPYGFAKKLLGMQEAAIHIMSGPQRELGIYKAGDGELANLIWAIGDMIKDDIKGRGLGLKRGGPGADALGRGFDLKRGGQSDFGHYAHSGDSGDRRSPSLAGESNPAGSPTPAGDRRSPSLAGKSNPAGSLTPAGDRRSPSLAGESSPAGSLTPAGDRRSPSPAGESNPAESSSYYGDFAQFGNISSDYVFVVNRESLLSFGQLVNKILKDGPKPRIVPFGARLENKKRKIILAESPVVHMGQLGGVAALGRGFDLNRGGPGADALGRDFDLKRGGQSDFGHYGDSGDSGDRRSPSPARKSNPAGSPSLAGKSSPAGTPSPTGDSGDFGDRRSPSLAGESNPVISPTPAGKSSPAGTPSPAGDSGDFGDRRSPSLAGESNPAGSPTPAGKSNPAGSGTCPFANLIPGISIPDMGNNTDYTGIIAPWLGLLSSRYLKGEGKLLCLDLLPSAHPQRERIISRDGKDIIGAEGISQAEYWPVDGKNAPGAGIADGGEKFGSSWPDGALDPNGAIDPSRSKLEIKKSIIFQNFHEVIAFIQDDNGKDAKDFARETAEKHAEKIDGHGSLKLLPSFMESPLLSENLKNFVERGLLRAGGGREIRPEGEGAERDSNNQIYRGPEIHNLDIFAQMIIWFLNFEKKAMIIVPDRESGELLHKLLFEKLRGRAFFATGDLNFTATVDGAVGFNEGWYRALIALKEVALCPLFKPSNPGDFGLFNWNLWDAHCYMTAMQLRKNNSYISFYSLFSDEVATEDIPLETEEQKVLIGEKLGGDNFGLGQIGGGKLGGDNFGPGQIGAEKSGNKQTGKKDIPLKRPAKRPHGPDERAIISQKIQDYLIKGINRKKTVRLEELARAGEIDQELAFYFLVNEGAKYGAISALPPFIRVELAGLLEEPSALRIAINRNPCLATIAEELARIHKKGQKTNIDPSFMATGLGISEGEIFEKMTECEKAGLFQMEKSPKIALNGNSNTILEKMGNEIGILMNALQILSKDHRFIAKKRIIVGGNEYGEIDLAWVFRRLKFHGFADFREEDGNFYLELPQSIDRVTGNCTRLFQRRRKFVDSIREAGPKNWLWRDIISALSLEGDGSTGIEAQNLIQSFEKDGLIVLDGPIDFKGWRYEIEYFR